MNSFPFCYVISSGSLTAGSSATITQTFDSSKRFRLKRIVASGNTAMTLQVSEVSGNNFSNTAFTTSLITGGTYKQGLPIFEDIIIPKGAQFRFQFTNGDSSTHTEEIQLWGEKID